MLPHIEFSIDSENIVPVFIFYIVAFLDLIGEVEVTILKVRRPTSRSNCSYCGTQYWPY